MRGTLRRGISDPDRAGRLGADGDEVAAPGGILLESDDVLTILATDLDRTDEARGLRREAQGLRVAAAMAVAFDARRGRARQVQHVVIARDDQCAGAPVGECNRRPVQAVRFGLDEHQHFARIALVTDEGKVLGSNATDGDFRPLLDKAARDPLCGRRTVRRRAQVVETVDLTALIDDEAERICVLCVGSRGQPDEHRKHDQAETADH